MIVTTSGYKRKELLIYIQINVHDIAVSHALSALRSWKTFLEKRPQSRPKIKGPDEKVRTPNKWDLKRKFQKWDFKKRIAF